MRPRVDDMDWVKENFYDVSEVRQYKEMLEESIESVESRLTSEYITLDALRGINAVEFRRKNVGRMVRELCILDEIEKEFEEESRVSCESELG